jgi:hypothetical protein
MIMPPTTHQNTHNTSPHKSQTAPPKSQAALTITTITTTTTITINSATRPQTPLQARDEPVGLAERLEVFHERFRGDDGSVLGFVIVRRLGEDDEVRKQLASQIYRTLYTRARSISTHTKKIRGREWNSYLHDGVDDTL